MTTRSFDALNLPYPKNLFTCETVERPPQVTSHNIYQKIHFVHISPELFHCKCDSSQDLESTIATNRLNYLLLTHVHPFLFLRQDFLKKFIHKVSIRAQGLTEGYTLDIEDNGQMKVVLDRHLYHRFGIPAIKKHQKRCKYTSERLYPIFINLKDEKMLKPEKKYYNRILDCVQRLPPIPALLIKTDDLSSLESFFKDVIREYNLDGQLPKPLSSVETINPTIIRHNNRMQKHPCLNYQVEDGDSKADNLIELLHWIGYQVLSLDCTRPEISEFYQCKDTRVAVECQSVDGFFTSSDVNSLMALLEGASCLKAILIKSNITGYREVSHGSNRVRLESFIQHPKCQNSEISVITHCKVEEKL